MGSLQSGENRFFGMYRARVVEVDIEEDGEKNAYGAVRVYIPDLYIKEINNDIDEFKDGIMAYPANTPFGGYNYEDSDKDSYCGRSVYTPRKNSYVIVFFEGGDTSRCFYIAPWHGAPDPNDKSGNETVKVPMLPPECRGKKLKSPHKVILVAKSGEGRAIVISDDENEPRIELTGRKRKLKKDDPHGDEDSVYDIDENQTVIVINEKDGKEQILIKTYKGDYINVDVEGQSLNIEFKNDISIKAGGKFSVDAGELQIKSQKTSNYTSGMDTSMKAGTSASISAPATVGITSSGLVTVDSPMMLTQTGCSMAPNKPAQPSQPTGQRA